MGSLLGATAGPGPELPLDGICYSNDIRAALPVSSDDNKVCRARGGIQGGQQAGGHCVHQHSMAAPTQPSADRLPLQGLELIRAATK